MLMRPGALGDVRWHARSHRVGLLAAWALGLAPTSPCVRADEGPEPATIYYSTAAVPPELEGPRPGTILLAWNDATAASAHVESQIDRAVTRASDEATKPEAPPRVASVADHANAGLKAAEPSKPDPIALAKKAIRDCQARYGEVKDYTCTFVKRERIDGRLSAQHVMAMKFRAHPQSIYFKFQTPNRGREAIYVQGRNGGKIIAHDVGFGKLLAGTMHLDPRGSMAMEDTRHPVTEAGIGSLIDTVARHWAVELTPAESVVTFHPNLRVGNHPCTMIESDHPRRGPGFLFHKVKLYIDQEHGLPIRFEAYDWPKHPGAPPELVEEYTYLDLKTNLGLREHDFDPSNKQYSFGRF